jgi:hypothetical protein
MSISAITAESVGNAPKIIPGRFFFSRVVLVKPKLKSVGVRGSPAWLTGTGDIMSDDPKKFCPLMTRAINIEMPGPGLQVPGEIKIPVIPVPCMLEKCALYIESEKLCAIAAGNCANYIRGTE